MMVREENILIMTNDGDLTRGELLCVEHEARFKERMKLCDGFFRQKGKGILGNMERVLTAIG
jgi:hypothetical protein